MLNETRLHSFRISRSSVSRRHESSLRTSHAQPCALSAWQHVTVPCSEREGAASVALLYPTPVTQPQGAHLPDRANRRHSCAAASSRCSTAHISGIVHGRFGIYKLGHGDGEGVGDEKKWRRHARAASASFGVSRTASFPTAHTSRTKNPSKSSMIGGNISCSELYSNCEDVKDCSIDNSERIPVFSSASRQNTTQGWTFMPASASQQARAPMCARHACNTGQSTPSKAKQKCFDMNYPPRDPRVCSKSRRSDVCDDAMTRSCAAHGRCSNGLVCSRNDVCSSSTMGQDGLDDDSAVTDVCDSYPIAHARAQTPLSSLRQPPAATAAMADIHQTCLLSGAMSALLLPDSVNRALRRIEPTNSNAAWMPSTIRSPSHPCVRRESTRNDSCDTELTIADTNTDIVSAAAVARRARKLSSSSGSCASDVREDACALHRRASASYNNDNNGSGSNMDDILRRNNAEGSTDCCSHKHSMDGDNTNHTSAVTCRPETTPYPARIAEVVSTKVGPTSELLPPQRTTAARDTNSIAVAAHATTNPDSDTDAHVDIDGNTLQPGFIELREHNDDNKNSVPPSTQSKALAALACRFARCSRHAATALGYDAVSRSRLMKLTRDWNTNSAARSPVPAVTKRRVQDVPDRLNGRVCIAGAARHATGNTPGSFTIRTAKSLLTPNTASSAKSLASSSSPAIQAAAAAAVNVPSTSLARSTGHRGRAAPVLEEVKCGLLPLTQVWQVEMQRRRELREFLTGLRQHGACEEASLDSYLNTHHNMLRRVGCALLPVASAGGATDAVDNMTLEELMYVQAEAEVRLRALECSHTE